MAGLAGSFNAFFAGGLALLLTATSTALLFLPGFTVGLLGSVCCSIAQALLYPFYVTVTIKGLPFIWPKSMSGLVNWSKSRIDQGLESKYL